ncbi:MAG: HAMP domain-containing histidine kinase [Phycisphaerae bacterium]|nr:HAMP domain-containing histidine kinase [Phycisphaerae bacterium]
MRRSHRTAWWCVYGVGSAAVLLALGWVTLRVVTLQRDEAMARAEVRRQELVRQVLWRMDSWLAPRLAREAARTWFEYESYYPQLMAYNRALEPLNAGEVVLPSPLLDFTSDDLPLHFQYRDGVGFTSPQVPAEVYTSQEIVGCRPVPADPVRSARLAALAASLNASDLKARLIAGESAIASTTSGDSAPDATSAPVAPPPPASKMAPEQWTKMQTEAAYDLKARQGNTTFAQQQVIQDNRALNLTARLSDSEPGAQPVQIGAMLPMWVGAPDAQLVLVRRVVLNSETIVQGVLVNWPVLKRELLERAADLMPGADLIPTPAGSVPDPAVTLASVPVVLVPPANLADAGAATGATGLAGLGLVWLAALGALGTTGLALRSTIASAVQTSRFASSVTHELRTPLTTFRLYAEMLNDGMVTDDEQRRAYLTTLRDESARLGFLVENVLTWSRVEEGRATVEPRRVSSAELVSATEALLKRRCDEAGATFTVRHCDEPAHTAADADRVRQVLFNLVDNACKYAGQAATVQLSSEVRDGSFILAVDDDGPGIPPRLQRRIFQAFDRGARGPGDAVRGLGLGLAISRELARSLGGELTCATSALGGARFELSLPIVG